jgi:hypothetical protein
MKHKSKSATETDTAPEVTPVVAPASPVAAAPVPEPEGTSQKSHLMERMARMGQAMLPA